VHSRLFAEFERICTRLGAGGHVLEVGAVPSEDTLLCLPALAGAKSKVGINLEGPCRHRDFEILRADVNALFCFPDESFDTVLCNSVLEHDKFFWKSVNEMNRVTRPGGLIVIGVPGFSKLPVERTASRLARMLRRLKVSQAALDAMDASTLTLRTHNFPGDFYRFSPQAVKEVLLDGLLDKELHTLMLPPRMIGVGVKPRRAPS
jgi:SAM-dependent methyltransferase